MMSDASDRAAKFLASGCMLRRLRAYSLTGCVRAVHPRRLFFLFFIFLAAWCWLRTQKGCGPVDEGADLRIVWEVDFRLSSRLTSTGRGTAAHLASLAAAATVAFRKALRRRVCRCAVVPAFPILPLSADPSL